MNRFSLFLKYIHYLWYAQSAHSLHSPFVFELYNNVLRSEKKPGSYDRILMLYKLQRSDNTQITLVDFGVGSYRTNSNNSLGKKIRTSSVSVKYGLLLYRIAQHYKPHYILELGTAAGFSSIFMAAGSGNAVIKSIEGNPDLCALARKNHTLLGLSNIDVICGRFEDKLPLVLADLPHTDLVFIDGNHNKEATIAYFKQILSKCANDSIIVFDDIRWSAGMLEAWKEISTHPRVSLSVDLFRIGLVYLRKELSKQHLMIRY